MKWLGWSYTCFAFFANLLFQSRLGARLQPQLARLFLGVTLRRARRSTRFFAERLPERPRALTAEALPLIDKTDWLAHYGDANVPGLSLEQARAIGGAVDDDPGLETRMGRTWIALSTGTTGPRTPTLADFFETWGYVGFVAASMVPFGFRPWRRERILFSLRSDSSVYRCLGSLGHRYRFLPLAASDDEVARALTEFRPTLIVGPPSHLERVGALCSERKLGPPVRLLVAGAEPLDGLSRRRLSTLFPKARLADCYFTAEGLVAVSCPHGNLHPPTGVTLLRLLPLTRGRARLVLTMLQRRAMPVIGFDLGDIVRVEDEPCACGHPGPSITAVEGRLAKQCLSVGDGWFFPSDLAGLVADTPGLVDYCAQLSPEGSTLFLAGDLNEPTRTGLALRLQDALRALGYETAVTAVAGSPQRPPWGKRGRLRVAAPVDATVRSAPKQAEGQQRAPEAATGDRPGLYVAAR